MLKRWGRRAARSGKRMLAPFLLALAQQLVSGHGGHTLSLLIRLQPSGPCPMTAVELVYTSLIRGEGRQDGLRAGTLQGELAQLPRPDPAIPAFAWEPPWVHVLWEGSTKV